MADTVIDVTDAVVEKGGSMTINGLSMADDILAVGAMQTGAYRANKAAEIEHDSSIAATERSIDSAERAYAAELRMEAFTARTGKTIGKLS